MTGLTIGECIEWLERRGPGEHFRYAIIGHLRNSGRLRAALAQLEFGGDDDAYHNLSSAIIDIERANGDCDATILKTLKRIECQLAGLNSRTKQDTAK